MTKTKTTCCDIYGVEPDGTPEIINWGTRDRFLRSLAFSRYVWAAELSVLRDGDDSFAIADVIVGTDIDAHYENAKSWVQENLI